MPRDILSDSLAALRIVEHEEDQYPLEESPQIRNDGMKRQSSLTSQHYSRDDRACYYNYGVNDMGHNKCDSIQMGKTNSLPSNSSVNQSWDEVVCSALGISPEDIANQLTLLDLPSFQSIKAEELTDCSWNKRNKITAAPNVVAFTRRFNQVSFWTVQEVLNGPTPKARAEMIVHFIKVAKKLHELNNIHSLFAIISALQSVSIFRLNKTWMCLSKKDKQVFDKLAEIFVEKDNWAALRDYLKSLSLPCIPYLGIFLTDLVYINIAHPAGSPHRASKMAVVLESVAKYQKSEYSLKPLPNVNNYLKSVRYIEELQKFLEDDQYKLSLKLEPPSPVGSSAGSKESVKGWDSSGTGLGTSTPFNISPSHRPYSGSLRLTTPLNQTKFLPGHRKCRSLGSKFRSTSLPRNFHKVGGVGGIFNKNYGPDNSTETTTMGSVNLLDDTLLESPISTLDANLTCSVIAQPVITGLDHFNLGYQGFVRRKTVLKDGRKPSLASWQRYWMQIWASSLIYFSPKSFKGSHRTDFRGEPCKMVPLEGWVAMYKEGESSDVFQLLNQQTASLYKFRTGSEDIARMWVSKIQEVTYKPVKPLPANLMTFE